MTAAIHPDRKVILITGASSAVGEASARLLASEGHRVVLGARRTECLTAVVAAIRAEGGSAECFALDVTRLDEVREFVAFAEDVYGRVDVIIDNTGVMPLSTLEALKVEEWSQMVDVNIRGVLHSTAAGPVAQPADMDLGDIIVRPSARTC